VLASAGLQPVRAETIHFEAKDTLTALEMNQGDELRFRLRCGRVFTLILEDTEAAIVERVEPGGIVYRFAARVRVDGQPMALERYVCAQECFYEPYVINGVRIWLDTVKDVFDLIPIRYPRQGNLQCLPRKSARLALQDASLRICPQETLPWIEHETGFLDVGACYNGDDCYLGPYLGRACHVGMDINHAKGSTLTAPIDFDTQAYFDSLAMGDNNNRWRGIRRWPNGDIWALQTHHLIELLTPEKTPLPAGTQYATTAGVHVGSHEHTHFEFKIGRPWESSQREASAVSKEQGSSIAFPIDFDDQSELAQDHPEVLHLDPWIVFWQTLEDRKARRGEIEAAMEPLSPARTGREVDFAAQRSRAGPRGSGPECYWTFGDGGWARGARVTHVFAQPGVYPVTLVVDDGAELASLTQHITVSGGPVPDPVLVLTAPDEPSFRRRPIPTLDVYGQPVVFVPHTLEFVARSSRPVPRSKVVLLQNLGGGHLAKAVSPKITCQTGSNWLSVTAGDTRNRQRLSVAVDATNLEPGTYSALVSIDCAGALASPQAFRVRLRMPRDPPLSRVTVDDRDPGFYATPYFWVGHRFCRCPDERRGHGGFYLTNGARARHGEFARFTPDLKAGRYEVSFSPKTPFATGTEFDVRIRHKLGDEVRRVNPTDSRVIGTFEFDEGMDGFVEIHAGNSTGMVIADAIIFK
jgi:hypothetical protein